MEIWKDVIGYEGLYEVSNFGRIRTKEGKVTSNARYEERKWAVRYLKDKTPKGRDYRVDLWKDGKPKSFLAHRLVAFVFLGKVEGKDCVNHKDGNTKNNRVENLEWCDHKENSNHAFDNGLMKSSKKTSVKSLETGEEIIFRSMTKASLYLGREQRFLSGKFIKTQKNEIEYNGYIIKKF